MKKIIYLVIAFISLSFITSCSKDDDNEASLTGKWEYLKEGVVNGGQEVLTDYEHQIGCTKDYSLISAASISDYSYFEDVNPCEERIRTVDYTRNGNNILFTFEGQILEAVIKTLNSTTLKFYYPDPENTEIFYVVVYKRIN